MSKKSLYLLGILVTIVLGTLLYIKLCSCCIGKISPMEPSVAVEESESKGTSYPFQVTSGDFSIDSQENFNFKESSFDIIQPLGQKLTASVFSLQKFLNANSNQKLDIMGHFTEVEDNTSAFPDLGIARANAIKNFLVGKGIPIGQLSIAGSAKNEMVPTEGIYLGSCSFAFSESVATDADMLETLAKSISDNPLHLRFETGASTITLNAVQRQKFAAIVSYLDKDPNAQCTIEGHTDNTGTQETNMALGKERAEFAKTYLVRQGLASDRIQTVSFGSDRPVAPNDTEEGRSQNRRTIINIQQ